MRKLLLPLDKHLRVEAGSHGGLLLGMRHELKFMYMVREVTLQYAHREFEELASNIQLVLEHQHRRTQVDLSQRTEQLQDKHVKATTPVSCAMMDALQLMFEFNADSLHKLTQHLEGDAEFVRASSDRRLTPSQLLSSCFLGLEVLCYNLEIYQDIDFSVDLLNVADRLEKDKRHQDAQLVKLHLACIAKHRLRWKEAETLLKSMQLAGDVRRQQEVLLNLIDATPDSSSKLKVIVQLARINCGKPDVPLPNEAQLLRPASLFKHCKRLIGIITEASELNTFMGFCTYLNIVTYFVNEVACSIADCLVGIFQRIFAFSQHKKLWKRIRNESSGNHQLLTGCIASFFDSVRCCSLSFTSGYVQNYVEWLLQRVCLEEAALIRPNLAILLVSYLSKDIKDLRLRIRFDQWFAVAYYVEGGDLTKHFEVDLKLYTNKDSKEEMSLLEEDLKSSGLFSLTAEAMSRFVAELSQNFIQLMLSPELNFLLLHHFLQLTNVFCLSASEHNRDIKPGFSAALIPLYKPLKMLIGRLVDAAVEPVDVFRRAWDIFVEFFTIIEDYLEEKLLNVVMGLLNKHLCRGELSLAQLPFIEATCSGLNGVAINCDEYSDLIERAFSKVCQLLPNSIHTNCVYSLLEKLIVFQPKLLESSELFLKLLEQLTSAYTDEDERWKQFVADVGKRVLINSSLLRVAVEFLCNLPKPQPPRIRKAAQPSQQEYRIRYDREVRKVHLLSCWLKIFRDLRTPNDLTEYLLQLADDAVKRVQLTSDPKDLNLEFHRFYCLGKHLALLGVELSTRYFSLFEMQHSPIVFGCLALMAANRKAVSPLQQDTYFRVALDQIDSPWRNINDLAFFLVVQFARMRNPQITEVLARFIRSGQQYPSLMALSILHMFCLQYEAQEEAERQVSALHEIVAALGEPICELYNGYSCKEQEDLTYYVVNRLKGHFRVLGEQEVEYLLTPEEDRRFAEALDLTARMDAIVERQFAKESDDYLKAEINLPRKTEINPKNSEENETFFETTDESTPAIKPSNEVQPQSKEAIDLRTTNHHRVPIRQIQIHVSTPKTPPVTSAAATLPKKISQQPAKLFTTPRANQQDKEPAHKRTPKNSSTATKHHSPVVEVESRHEKFRINLGHLNERWRQGLEMIHKKVKPLSKRRN